MFGLTDILSKNSFLQIFWARILFFFAVQDSSMEDIVTQSDSHLLFYMLNYCEAIRRKDQNIAKGTTDPKNCIYTEGIGFLER